MNNKYLEMFNVNTEGRDFVVSDIHGMYDEFISILRNLEFDYEKDRMFSVGDIIDRGNDSAVLIEMLEEPWFNAVMGNHEDMMVSLLNLYKDFNTDMLKNLIVKNRHETIIYNGGEWLLEISYLKYVSLSFQILSNMPYAITVKVIDDKGNLNDIGISHAQPLKVWKDISNYNIQNILWGGPDILPYTNRKLTLDNINTDVLASYHGHFLTHVPVIKNSSANFLDAGGFRDGKIPVVQLTDQGKYVNKLVMPL